MQKTSNPNACASAKRLLNYLSETAGKAIITGQHTQTKLMEEIDYIRDNTGKEPLLRGFELLAYSPNINYDDASQECLTEVYENRETVENALDWAKETNGIVTLTFHWFSPLGGHDKSFYSKNTDFDAEQVIMKNTRERSAFYHDMDVIAKELRKFQQADIPVLWRPFHEAEGDWFWWGAKGPVIASKLYCMMYEYYTNILHLDNLIWVWNCPVKEAYPGDEYVDIVSVDIYLTGYEKTDYHIQYEQLIKETSPNKTAALAEVGYIPDINILEQSHIPWAYYMTWSKEFCIGEQYNSLDNLKSMYDSGYSLCMG
ncbi:MAG: beta-mannosidase [Lachnospiraceae bacterium]|nr:beta-mannosidase [Lachnospiraceae bacterium]